MLAMQADKKMDIDQTSWAVMREISRMAYNVDADQITRAVNQLKAQTLFSQDGPSGEPMFQSLSATFRHQILA